MVYKSASALEMAVKAAAKASPQDTDKAIAGFYHHRLLCRIFSEADSPFVLKGGYGMLARTTDARYTRDIDLVTSKLDSENAVAELNRLARKDMGDFVSFVPKGWRPIKAEDKYRSGYTVSFDAYLGAKRIRSVAIDLVSDQIECGSVDLVTPADRLEIAGFENIAHPLYPSEKALADKLCGVMERHAGRPSSRTKDLVDIVVYALTEDFDNRLLSKTLRRELGVRGVSVPNSFSVPQEWHGSMEMSFKKAVSLSGIPDELKSMAAAEKVAIELFSLPLSSEAVDGVWDKAALSWTVRAL